jgi:hypothetical protein
VPKGCLRLLALLSPCRLAYLERPRAYLTPTLCEGNVPCPSPMYTEDACVSIIYRYSLRDRL